MLLLCALLGAANLVLTLSRSLIPFALDGTVKDIVWRYEKHIGLDDVFLLTVGGRTIQVDAQVAWALQPGDHVSKPAFARTAQVNGAAVRLTASREFWRMAIAMPLIVVICALLTRRKRGET